MRISLYTNNGSWWINVGKKHHGPFNCVRDASWVAIDMVTDHIQAKHGHNVYFLEGVTR